MSWYGTWAYTWKSSPDQRFAASRVAVQYVGTDRWLEVRVFHRHNLGFGGSQNDGEAKRSRKSAATAITDDILIRFHLGVMQLLHGAVEMM